MKNINIFLGWYRLLTLFDNKQKISRIKFVNVFDLGRLILSLAVKDLVKRNLIIGNWPKKY